MENKKELFCAALLSPADLTTGQKELLGNLSYRYPWFTLSKVMLMAYYGETADTTRKLHQQVALNLLSNSYYSVFTGLQPQQQPSAVQSDNPFGIIDAFLSKEVGAITPAPAAVSTDLAGEEDDDEMLLAMADNFVKMGLKSQALEIYSKLNLKYPEKSVYFAPIIASLKE